MCSIVMPADYEMLVSHSPPLFSHSPPSSFMGHHYEPFARAPRSFRPFQQAKSIASPKRPCLVIRPDDTPAINNDEDPTSPTRLKKRVVFADDRGMSLTHVRVMTEPSNVPPVWSIRFLAQVTPHKTNEPPEKSVEELQQQQPWEITFSQPASDYVEFRKQLDTNKVSLENVIIRESEDLIVGTVKVSNVSFEKEVILRVSSDEWKTHEDVPCNFVTNTSNNSVYVIYDTFSFKVPFPIKSNVLEFCVCFRCNVHEYWDNNNNKNYKLIRKVNSNKSDKNNNNSNTPKRVDPKLTLTIQSSDIYHAKVDSWSEFASWTHLENTSPYW